MVKYYAGIGSRKTPIEVLLDMRDHGEVLCTLGWTLRSGGANGADTAFEQGCDNGCDGARKEIYLPYKNFNDHSSTLYNIPEEAYEIAQEVYPYKFPANKPWIAHYMARNVLQILGQTLDTPSAFVLCWTPDGAETEKETSGKTGGTGQAIRLASRLDIPVFNLKNETAKIRFADFVNNFTGETIDHSLNLLNQNAYLSG